MNKRHATILFANRKFGTEFKWGTNDCNTLALEFIEFALPDVPSILMHVFEQYSDIKSALRFYRNFNYTWQEYLEEVGFEQVDPLRFQPGDLHIHDMDPGLKAVSINLGKNNIIADPKNGILATDFFALYEKYELEAYRYRG